MSRACKFVSHSHRRQCRHGFASIPRLLCHEDLLQVNSPIPERHAYSPRATEKKAEHREASISGIVASGIHGLIPPPAARWPNTLKEAVGETGRDWTGGTLRERSERVSGQGNRFVGVGLTSRTTGGGGGNTAA